MESPHGYIKLFRELLKKSIWLNSTPEQAKIFMYCLMRAAHSKNEWDWNGNRFSVEPGQFVASLESIKRGCGRGISVQNVRTALNRFEKMGFLTSKPTSTGRIITIINWQSYQGDQTENQQGDQQTVNKRLTPNKNVKNVKNVDSKGVESIDDYLNRIRYFFRGPQADYIVKQYKTMFPELDVQKVWDNLFLWLNDNADNLKKRRENLRSFVTINMKREAEKQKKNAAGPGRKGEL